MNSNSNPIYTLSMYLSLTMGLLFLLKSAPLLAPILAIIFLGVIIYRFFKSRKKEDIVNKASKRTIEELNKKNILWYGSWIKENLRGHDKVIDQILNQLQQNLILANANRTLGAYFLAGPTGTGKTFLAELVAQALFPDSKPIILRMNQYKLPSDVLTLLGPPPGHDGANVGGTLTKSVLENPNRVIILDEIDKCHKDVIDCLYNIIDSAQCTEKSSGKIVSFSRCVFFATTNAGVEGLRQVDAHEPNLALQHSKNREMLAQYSDLEKAFLARWDGVFFMDTLSPYNVAEIACLQIRKYWKQFDMDVVYASPEMLAYTVLKNNEFKDYGVRQLSTYIKMSTDPYITQAKLSGVKKVTLDVDINSKQIIVRAA